jgi:hypothetical protein
MRTRVDGCQSQHAGRCATDGLTAWCGNRISCRGRVGLEFQSHICGTCRGHPMCEARMLGLASQPTFRPAGYRARRLGPCAYAEWIDRRRQRSRKSRYPTRKQTILTHQCRTHPSSRSSSTNSGRQGHGILHTGDHASSVKALQELQDLYRQSSESSA